MNDDELEKAAEEYCPDRTVKMPNGEDLFIVHAKKQGFKAGARYAGEKSAERIAELEAGLKDLSDAIQGTEMYFAARDHARILLSPKDTQGEG